MAGLSSLFRLRRQGSSVKGCDVLGLDENLEETWTCPTITGCLQSGNPSLGQVGAQADLLGEAGEEEERIIQGEGNEKREH